MIGSINNPLIDIFLYSHHLSAWYCVDIVRRNSVLVTHGKWRDILTANRIERTATCGIDITAALSELLPEYEFVCSHPALNFQTFFLSYKNFANLKSLEADNSQKRQESHKALVS